MRYSENGEYSPEPRISSESVSCFGTEMIVVWASVGETRDTVIEDVFT